MRTRPSPPGYSNGPELDEVAIAPKVITVGVTLPRTHRADLDAPSGHGGRPESAAARGRWGATL